ncbi:peptidoglycan recognition protein [Actinoplanes sp. NPDC051343]|uniref:peptidoglycan recognition protein n=1 Tax=Actinoplanes sp. NPDC051343 TaxID=3363906 RepID=UPI00379F3770
MSKVAGDAGPALQTLPFAALGRSAAGGATLPEHTTKPFSLLGVTWTDPAAPVTGTVQIRTRAGATGRWTAWQSLESDGSQPGDARGSTDPLWVGESNGVQARVVGGHALPAGLRVDLINPDAAAKKSSLARAATPSPAPQLGGATSEPQTTAQLARSSTGGARSTGRTRTLALPTRPVPRMVTRSGWGANERIVKGAPEYTGPVQVFFVHHTATGNGYSCSQSAAIVRGIQAYQVRSKGWDDIGYNFLVDKCGNVFEGRAGGVGRPVLGAHTLGFNADASAIAVIGTFDNVGVNSAVRTAIATVAAYKLGAYGNNPAGTATLISGGGNLYPKGARATFWRISGHRDAGRTDCPGDTLYSQLPLIRKIAGAAPVGLRFQHMTGAVKRGRLLYTRGAIKPLWNLSTPSALINRFEVLVDGSLVLAEPGGHRTALLHLPPGGHTVTIRAEHLSGRVSAVTAKVVSDATAPVFTSGPEVALRTGALNGTVPVRLGWAASDVNGLSSVRLLRPTAVDLGTVAHSRNGTLRPGVPATFTVAATDRSGNVASGSVTRTPEVVSEAAAERTGTWRTLSNPEYLGGVALGSTAAGATATFAVTGRSAALVFGRGADSGRVRVFVDGVDAGLVDLRSTSTVFRQAVWSRSWADDGSHSVRVELQGPAVLDGLVDLK